MKNNLFFSLTTLIWFVPGWLPSLGQSNISGTAPLTLEDRGFDSARGAHGVTIYADLTGLSGIGGVAGLNAFAVTLVWDRTDVYHSLQGGQDPSLGWTFHHSDGLVIANENLIRLAAYVADENAPNQRYELATLYFAGSSGPLNFSLADVSLGSRVVNGDGPDLIPVDASATLAIDLTACDFAADPNCDGTTTPEDVTHLTDLLIQGAGTLDHDCNSDGRFSALDVICLSHMVNPPQNPAPVQTSLLDVDGGGQQGDLFTDGIMVALFMSGVTDPQALTNGLISPGAGRTDPASIMNYLNAISTIFDVDLNGSINLQTDGVMIWLYLSGVTGNELTDGLIGDGAQRTTSAQIKAYLDSLMN